jgi:pimeloyl-ACP methyl ester carboxylesterase
MKTQSSPAWSDTAAHNSGFVTANGIRLHYLDWGGLGPVLMLIHGGLDNAHVFDDLAPAFTDHFRVIAYDLRGHGRSDAKGPFDTATRTEDLCGLMYRLGINKAHLAGWSLGGNDITAMAGTHPERVDSIVYLEGAYDWGGPALADAFKSLPIDFRAPASAMRSLDAYREYQKTVWLPAVSDMSRFEAYVRDLVVIGWDRAAAHDRPRDAGGVKHCAHRPAPLYGGPFASPRDLCRDIPGCTERGPGPTREEPRLGAEIHGAIPGCIHRASPAGTTQRRNSGSPRHP